LIFLLGSYVSVQSPYSVYIEDALPNLGGAVLAALLVLCVFHNSVDIGTGSIGFAGTRREGMGAAPYDITGMFTFRIQKDQLIVHSARLVLLAIYAHHAFKLIWNGLVHRSSHDILEQTANLTKASFIACVGSVAAGVFKTNIDQKGQLEVLVRERTKEIRSKTKELFRINIAFEACDTAIAITDASRTVIWTNPAFEGLAEKTRTRRRRSSDDAGGVEDGGCAAAVAAAAVDDDDNSDDADTNSSIGRQLTDAIVLEGRANETKLRGAFDFSTPRQDEIEIHGDDTPRTGTDDPSAFFSSNKCGNYRVEVTPFADRDDLDDVLFYEDETAAAAARAVSSFRSVSSRNDNHGGFATKNSSKLFLVAFHDITADRAREQAEQIAREEALLSKAMKESMVTLTHELRTPLQGIMGITSLLLEQDFTRDAGMEPVAGSSFGKDAIESLGLVMASSSLLLNLINNLLDVKKATANMMDEFLLAPLLASDPIRDAIDFCNPLASISGVNIVRNCNGDTANAFVNANALRLQQVLINMVSNAIKYTDRGTTISIGTRSSTVGDTLAALRASIACSSGWEDPSTTSSSSSTSSSPARQQQPPPGGAPVLVVSVSDSGPGIDSDQSRRLFSRFARLDRPPKRTLGSSSVGQPTGTGLGLHLCQMFVHRMRGCIWAENNSTGKGSTFSFCLPLVLSPQQQQQQQHHRPQHQHERGRGRRRPSPGGALPAPPMAPSLAPPPGSEQEGRTGAAIELRHMRVLVVDDTLINRKVFDRMLKKIGVVHVCTAESGREALAKLFGSDGKDHGGGGGDENGENGKELYRCDLVITDLQMPGISGTELAEAIFRRRAEPPRGAVLLPPTAPPVVVGLTADTSPGVAEKCASSGMSDLLYKPITVVEIKDYFHKTVGTLRPGLWHRASEG